MDPARQQLLNKAAEIWCKYGIESASLREIGFEAGLNPPDLIFEYFSGKDDLLDGLIGYSRELIQSTLPSMERALIAISNRDIHPYYVFNLLFIHRDPESRVTRERILLICASLAYQEE